MKTYEDVKVELHTFSALRGRELLASRPRITHCLHAVGKKKVFVPARKCTAPSHYTNWAISAQCKVFRA
jgi:hypothetical protein